MSFTILFLLFSLLVAAALFAVIYRWKGLRAAFIGSAIALVLLIAGFVLALNVLLSGM